MLKETLSPLGELQTLSEKDARAHAHTTKRDVIIVDESGVKHAEELVARYSSQLDPPPVVVVFSTAKPQWKDALRLFKAGATDYIRKDHLAIFFQQLLGIQ